MRSAGTVTRGWSPGRLRARATSRVTAWLGLALLIWFAYRGWSVLLLAPAAAMPARYQPW